MDKEPAVTEFLSAIESVGVRHGFKKTSWNRRPGGDENVTLSNGRVVILFFYDARDRELLPKFMSPQHFSESGPDRIYVESKSLLRLLSCRMGLEHDSIPLSDIRDASQIAT